MPCKPCDAFDWFWEKIGRCRECMIKLAVFSVFAWPVWFYFENKDARSVETLIALIFAWFCSGLLSLHLLVWALTGGKGFSSRKKK